ncbi:hypothetical protein [Methylobacterium sp. JK268]
MTTSTDTLVPASLSLAELMAVAWTAAEIAIAALWRMPWAALSEMASLLGGRAPEQRHA